MAYAYIVNLNHGGAYSTVGKDIGNAVVGDQTPYAQLYDGQLLFCTSTYGNMFFDVYENGQWKEVHCGYGTGEWGEPTVNGNRIRFCDAWGSEVGYLQYIVAFNASRFGEEFNVAGGSKYRVAEDTLVCQIHQDATGNYYEANPRTLKSGCYVVFGAGQGFTGALGNNYIRIYGYYDLEGDWTETSGYFVKIHDLASGVPYCILTK